MPTAKGPLDGCLRQEHSEGLMETGEYDQAWLCIGSQAHVIFPFLPNTHQSKRNELNLKNKKNESTKTKRMA